MCSHCTQCVLLKTVICFGIALRDTCLTAPQKLPLTVTIRLPYVQGFFTLSNHINSLLLVNMSAICYRTIHSAGRGALHCFMILRCEAPAHPPHTHSPLPRPPKILTSLHPLCPPEVPGRQLWKTTARLWPDGCLFLRCNRNNPIKWWIAFHTDYRASVSPAGWGGQGRGLYSWNTHMRNNQHTGRHSHKFYKLIMAT